MVRVSGNYKRHNLLTPADETNAVRSLMVGESPMVLILWTVAAMYSNQDGSKIVS
jgi:hypothetical protein